jgi:2,3-bisphosphoglycerate-independent phosphoglycerate mutase
VEDFDREVVGRVLDGLEKFGEYTVLALPDHPTPVALKTHTPDPVPFAVMTSVKSGNRGVVKFSERTAAQTGLLIDDCNAMIEEFFGRPEQVCDIT